MTGTLTDRLFTAEFRARKDAARVLRLQDQLVRANMQADASFEKMLDACREAEASYRWDSNGLPQVYRWDSKVADLERTE